MFKGYFLYVLWYMEQLLFLDWSLINKASAIGSETVKSSEILSLPSITRRYLFECLVCDQI